MKIAVIGATGATGEAVLNRALELNHEVIAVARRPEKIVNDSRLTIKQGDVLDLQSIQNAIEGADAVISCIGPPSNNSQNSSIHGLKNFVAGMKVMRANFTPGTVMSEGIPNIVKACKQAGVKRFVMQSGINLTDGKELNAANRVMVKIMRTIFSNAIKDKEIAEKAVIQSDLQWVIVRASVLKYGLKSLKYTAGPKARIAPLQQLPFADCADGLVRAASSEDEWIKKIINVGK
ncbi:NAD(P)-dependent oxidoreductase [Alkalicoccobacillus murimartini]|uniref:Uncharacterized protein YbjT (DUF2867 family) n=1 Tax=Alkalicoccobacillus murimartini TaxID=171685 RepID=A0ABT9YLY4_9BACI|nr:NAD(P)H-binding protein [Alkalicoccobacillus murimartini]MDQ0208603.1 uncharacterized protein YbjT (DUF2867 family) [Alkalicoccobacillus murimartini]